jgi:hypothetical protein
MEEQEKKPLSDAALFEQIRGVRLVGCELEPSAVPRLRVERDGDLVFAVREPTSGDSIGD